MGQWVGELLILRMLKPLLIIAQNTPLSLCPPPVGAACGPPAFLLPAARFFIVAFLAARPNVHKNSIDKP